MTTCSLYPSHHPVRFCPSPGLFLYYPVGIVGLFFFNVPGITVKRKNPFRGSRRECRFAFSSVLICNDEPLKDMDSNFTNLIFIILRVPKALARMSFVFPCPPVVAALWKSRTEVALAEGLRAVDREARACGERSEHPTAEDKTGSGCEDSWDKLHFGAPISGRAAYFLELCGDHPMLLEDMTLTVTSSVLVRVL